MYTEFILTPEVAIVRLGEALLYDNAYTCPKGKIPSGQCDLRNSGDEQVNVRKRCKDVAQQMRYLTFVIVIL